MDNKVLNAVNNLLGKWDIDWNNTKWEPQNPYDYTNDGFDGWQDNSKKGLIPPYINPYKSPSPYEVPHDNGWKFETKTVKCDILPPCMGPAKEDGVCVHCNVSIHKGFPTLQQPIKSGETISTIMYCFNCIRDVVEQSTVTIDKNEKLRKIVDDRDSERIVENL